MCDKAIEIKPFLLGCIPDRYKTQEMLKKAIEKDSQNLRYIPNDPRFLKMCEEAVKDVPWRL